MMDNIGFMLSSPFLRQFFLRATNPKSSRGMEKNYLLSYKTKEYQNYLSPILAKLEELPANRFQPNLELLEQLIQSLEVNKK